MTKEEIDLFIKLTIQLYTFHNEISIMAKKAPDRPINEFKLKFINLLITDINSVLDSRKPFKDFNTFDEDKLPSNSDVTMILSQYLASSAKYYNEHTLLYNGRRYLRDNKESKTIQVERLQFLESIFK